jgi:hypothetical protein
MSFEERRERLQIREVLPLSAPWQLGLVRKSYSEELVYNRTRVTLAWYESCLTPSHQNFKSLSHLVLKSSMCLSRNSHKYNYEYEIKVSCISCFATSLDTPALCDSHGQVEQTILN